MKKINFKQPKYMLPAILYFPLVGLGWLIVDIFQTEIPESTGGMKSTEYLNADLPDAKVKDIGSKRDNMLKSFGSIRDETAVGNIERQEDAPQEEFESRYSDEEVAQLSEQMRQMELEKARQDSLDRLKHERERELSERSSQSSSRTDEFSGIPTEEERQLRSAALQKERFDELERELGKVTSTSNARLLAEYRRRYGNLPGMEDSEQEDTTEVEKEPEAESKPKKKKGGFFDTESEAVSELDQDAEAGQVVKKKKGSSNQFNTIAENEEDTKMLRAIVDENIKVVDGSRLRLRLLDDAIVEGVSLKKGTYLYATMSGFSKQRIQGKIESVMTDNQIVKVDLHIYDLDGMQGLYVPESSFRETTKEVGAGAFQQSMGIGSTIGTGNMLTDFAGQTLQNAYQKTSQAIAKAIRKNKVRIKYGTQVYLLNGQKQARKQENPSARSERKTQNSLSGQQLPRRRYGASVLPTD